MKTLDELAETENRLLARLERVEGFLEERHVALERSGIPHEYAAVLTGYIDLLADPTAHREALKRAVFLAWYAQAEPAEFTGLWAITPVHIRRVCVALEIALAEDTADVELRAMLTWYVRVMGGAPFNDDPARESLSAFVAAADASEEEQPPWRPSVTQGRGQMGSYWRSLPNDA